MAVQLILCRRQDILVRQFLYRVARPASTGMEIPARCRLPRDHPAVCPLLASRGNIGTAAPVLQIIIRHHQARIHLRRNILRAREHITPHRNVKVDNTGMAAPALLQRHIRHHRQALFARPGSIGMETRARRHSPITAQLLMADITIRIRPGLSRRHASRANIGTAIRALQTIILHRLLHHRARILLRRHRQLALRASTGTGRLARLKPPAILLRLALNTAARGPARHAKCRHPNQLPQPHFLAFHNRWQTF